MNKQELDAIMEAEFEGIRELRATKGREYASDEDVLADFKDIARELDLSPTQVWVVYVQKHWRAVMSWVREGEVKSEAIESRVRDIMTYSILLLGLIREQESQENQKGHAGFASTGNWKS